MQIPQVNDSLNLGNICRERTGGQGYLSINRVESLIPLAHASITAEGDSAVLMQKVSKEYVDDFIKNLVTPPKSSDSKEILFQKKDIFKITTLLNLIKVREAALLVELTEKTTKNSKHFYDVWMLNENDLIQELALAFGERICIEESIKKLTDKK